VLVGDEIIIGEVEQGFQFIERHKSVSQTLGCNALI
jgi:hypothetical protein